MLNEGFESLSRPLSGISFLVISALFISLSFKKKKGGKQREIPAYTLLAISIIIIILMGYEIGSYNIYQSSTAETFSETLLYVFAVPILLADLFFILLHFSKTFGSDAGAYSKRSFLSSSPPCYWRSFRFYTAKESTTSRCMRY
jgi:hypothetical protein